MCKVIGWLFQNTADGATYLQAIILTVILVILAYWLFKDIDKMIEKIKEGSDEDDSEV